MTYLRDNDVNPEAMINGPPRPPWQQGSGGKKTVGSRVKGGGGPTPQAAPVPGNPKPGTPPVRGGPTGSTTGSTRGQLTVENVSRSMSGMGSGVLGSPARSVRSPSSQKSVVHMEEAEETSEGESGVEHQEVLSMNELPPGFRSTAGDPLSTDEKVTYHPGATVEELEPLADMIGTAVNQEEVWIVARTYAKQEVHPLNNRLKPPEGKQALRDMYPQLFATPSLFWQALKGMLRSKGVMQKGAGQGLILFRPSTKGQGTGQRRGGGAGGSAKHSGSRNV